MNVNSVLPVPQNAEDVPEIILPAGGVPVHAVLVLTVTVLVPVLVQPPLVAVAV